MSTSRWFWHELMTPDPDAARPFYAAVIGFTFQAWPDPAMDYTIVNTPGGKGVGGLMKLPAEVAAMGAPPHWMGTVAVADVDAVAARCAELGGKVLNGPFDIPAVGRYAVLADPQGAAFSIMKPGTPGESDLAAPSEPGAVVWNELWTSDADAGFAFYCALFGWSDAGSMDMGAEGTYRMYGVGGAQLGGVARMMPGQPAPAWLYYFAVESAEAAAETIRAHGGQVLVGPHDAPGGRFVIAVDPQGAAFGVYAAAR